MGRSQRHLREIQGVDSGGYVGEPPELPAAQGGTQPAPAPAPAPDEDKP